MRDLTLTVFKLDRNV